ncbi:Asp23/Gls24 family envelope stress response protein [Oscillospiraceae bacterium PP1C4]
MENQFGTIEISQEYFSNLVGKAASECFGVAGMINSPTQGIRSAIAGRDTPDKGVHVRNSGGGLVIDLHIVVVYGMNISAIVKSIVNKVRYTVEQATNFDVAKVNVFVDAMKTDNA